MVSMEACVYHVLTHVAALCANVHLISYFKVTGRRVLNLRKDKGKEERGEG